MEAFWVLNLVFATGFGWRTIQFYGVVVLLGFVERFCVVMFHVATAALAGHGFASGRPWRYLLLVVGLHSLINYLVLVGQEGLVNVIGFEIGIGLLAVATMGLALWVRFRRGREEATAEAHGHTKIAQ
jgi:hypothetical protein